MIPHLLDVYAARKRLSRHLQPTPLLRSQWLSAIAGADVWLKLESLHLTGSFKIRGAMNAALRVLETHGRDAPPLVAASAGNHGRALAYAVEQLGLSAVIFTPRTAPQTKKQAIRHHGATLRDEAPDYDQAETAARSYANAHGGIYISPYNDPDVIAGAGTVALEIVEALPQFDEMIVPLGGGGLASGIGLVIAACGSWTQPGHSRSHAALTGVEATASTPFATGFKAGRITHIDPQPSLADGLTGNLEADTITFELVRRTVRTLIAVDESELGRAVRELAREEHLIVEGAGAAATAALLAGKTGRPGQSIVVLVTGANIDAEKLGQLLSRNV